MFARRAALLSAGGCAAGTPPDNLGFRLVREESSLVALRRKIDWHRASRRDSAVWVPAFAGTTAAQGGRALPTLIRVLGVLQRDAEFGFGLGLDLVERDAVGELDQGHAVIAVL